MGGGCGWGSCVLSLMGPARSRRRRPRRGGRAPSRCGARPQAPGRVVTDRLVLASLSAAMDGGLTAIAEVAEVLAKAGKPSESRLIGGVAVLLHQQRLSIRAPAASHRRRRARPAALPPARPRAGSSDREARLPQGVGQPLGTTPRRDPCRSRRPAHTRIPVTSASHRSRRRSGNNGGARTG